MIAARLQKKETFYHLKRITGLKNYYNVIAKTGMV